MRQIFDKDNIDHDYFHGSQKALDQAIARRNVHTITDSQEQKNVMFDWIDKYITKVKDGIFSILINRSKPDADGNTIDTFISL